jgi:hypothetical protein
MSQRARQTASKSSAPVVAPAARRTIATPASAAVPADRRRGRSDATLVEASVTARLLGLRILTLDAKVALVPADVTIAAAGARAPAGRAPTLSSGSSRGRTRSVAAHGLADALRNLDEGARLLAEVQRRSRS